MQCFWGSYSAKRDSLTISERPGLGSGFPLAGTYEIRLGWSHTRTVPGWGLGWATVWVL